MNPLLAVCPTPVRRVMGLLRLPSIPRQEYRDKVQALWRNPIWLSSLIFFFSSRRRHTRLQGDWIQTCALPISTGGVFDAILHREPTEAVRLNTAVPAELQRIIDKAIEKDRELRYHSAADLRTDLKRLKRDTDSGRRSGGDRPTAAASAGAAASTGGKS